VSDSGLHRIRSGAWTLFSSQEITDLEELERALNCADDPDHLLRMFIFRGNHDYAKGYLKKPRVLSRDSILSFFPDCQNLVIAIHDNAPGDDGIWRGYLEIPHIDYVWRLVLTGSECRLHYFKRKLSSKPMTETQLVSLAEMYQDIASSGINSMQNNAIALGLIQKICHFFDQEKYHLAGSDSETIIDDGLIYKHGRSFVGEPQVTISRNLISPWDLRMKLQVQTLLSAGAHVSLVGAINEEARQLFDEEVELLDTARLRFKHPRLGEPDICYPIRVATNLTWTNALRFACRFHQAFLEGNNAKKLIVATNPDIVHVHDVFQVDKAFQAARKSGAKMILDTRDLVAAEGYFFGKQARKAARLEETYIRSADEILVVSDASAQYLNERYGVEDVTTVMNALPAPTRVTRQPADRKRLIFQGNLHYNRNLLALVRAMTMIRDDAELTIQGWGLMLPLLKSLVKRLDLEDTVRFAPPCAPQDTGILAQEHDMGVICYPGSTVNLQMTVPNKLLSYLNAGLAVIVTDLPGPRSLAGDSIAVEYIDVSSWENLAQGLRNAVGSSIPLVERREAAYDLADEYCWERAQETYLDIYERLLKETS